MLSLQSWLTLIYKRLITPKPARRQTRIRQFFPVACVERLEQRQLLSGTAILNGTILEIIGSLRLASLKAGIDEKTARKEARMSSEQSARHLWRTRVDPFASKREQLRSMIADLPPDTLLTADCGFFGYEFWSELVVSNREFVIRVGGNDRLLMKTEPKPRRRKKEKTAGTQAVKLRMPPFQI